MIHLVVLGGAAVLEVHRALTGGSKDINVLRQREEELKKTLTVRGGAMGGAG